MNNDQCRLKMTPLLACLALATANDYGDAEKIGHCLNCQCFKMLIKRGDELDLNTTHTKANNVITMAYTMRKGIYIDWVRQEGGNRGSCDSEAYASDSYANVGVATTISYRHSLCKDQVNFNCIKTFKSHLQQLQLIKCVKTIVNGIIFIIYGYHYNLGLSDHNYDQIILLVSDQSSYACCLVF